jgi:WD40 repeat protein
MYSTVYTLSAPNFRVFNNYSKGSFSADGTFVASGGADGLVYIWKEGILASTLKKHGYCYLLI